MKKILVLVSNPKGTDNLDLLPEIRDLQEALQRSLNRDRFIVEWRIAKRQADLRRYILDIKPSIIHFCGHGTEQGLVLEDDTGKAKVEPLPKLLHNSQPSLKSQRFPRLKLPSISSYPSCL